MAKSWNKTTPANGSVAIFELKTLLKAAGWTVPRSSDGSTYNAAGDQITVSGSGAGGMANSNAWFVLRSPNAAHEWCFQRGTTNLVWRVKFSAFTFFVGGSPSASQVPSATNEHVMCGAGTDAAPTFHTLLEADGTYRWNCMADNSAPYGWWAAVFSTGGSAPHDCIVFDPLTQVEPTESFPYVCIVNRFVTPFTVAALCTETSTNAAGSTNVNHTRVASAGTGAVTHMPAMTYTLGTSTTVVPNALGTNPISAEDQPFPFVWGRRAAAGNGGYKGISTLLKWNAVTRTTGDTLSVNGTRDRIVYGDISLDWDGSVPTV